MAILNANYLKDLLKKDFEILYQGKNKTVAHEMIIDCRGFKSNGINVDYINNESPLVLECQHFIKCCNEHIQPITDGEEGLRDR